jgi:Ca2+-binding EF-hand superfamily protein
VSQVRFRAFSRYLYTKFRFSDYLGVLYGNVGPRFKDMFNRFDVDGTGVIDASKLRQGLMGFG